MRTIISAAVLSVIFSLSVLSQETFFGVETGMNLGSLSVNQGIGTSVRIGLHGGVFIEAETSQNFSMMWGLYYTQRGNAFKNSTVTLEQHMDYLEIPLILNIKFPAGRITPYISGGFYYAAMINSKQTEENIAGEEYENNTWDDYIGYDFGITGGLGVSYKFSKKIHVFTAANYCLGMSDIIEDFKFKTIEASNNGIKLSAGVKFVL